jgi:outer membrane protein assembly factor BamB
VVYAGALDGPLYAITPEGKLKWEYPVNSIVNSTPTLAPNGQILISSNDGNLYAFSADGRPIWQYRTRHAPSSVSAVGEDGTVYIGSHDGDLYALITARGGKFSS